MARYHFQLLLLRLGYSAATWWHLLRQIFHRLNGSIVVGYRVIDGRVFRVGSSVALGDRASSTYWFALLGLLLCLIIWQCCRRQRWSLNWVYLYWRIWLILCCTFIGAITGVVMLASTTIFSPKIYVVVHDFAFLITLDALSRTLPGLSPWIVHKTGTLGALKYFDNYAQALLSGTPWTLWPLFFHHRNS